MKAKNRKFFIAALGVVLILTTVAWPSRTAKVPETATEQPDSERRELTAEKEKQIKQLTKELEEAKRSAGASEVYQVTERLAAIIGGRAGAMLRMAAARNMDIELHGKVFDQAGNSVVGAKVSLQITGGGSLAPGTGPVEVITDTNGHFKAIGKGQSVTIMEVDHPEIADLYFHNRHDGRRDTNLHLFGDDTWGQDSSWQAYTDKSNPFEIRVWRNKVFEKVTSRKGTFHIPVNGKRIIFDGRLEVGCMRDSMDNRRDYGDWAISLKPRDGGIQETDDLYLNEAPLNGYQPSHTTERRVGESGYSHSIRPGKSFYFTSGNRALYGSLEIAYEPYAKRNKCVILTKSKFNENGSRNLAVKSER